MSLFYSIHSLQIIETHFVDIVYKTLFVCLQSRLIVYFYTATKFIQQLLYLLRYIFGVM